MKLLSILAETAFKDRLIKDSRLLKQLTIAWRHDQTIPRIVAIELGPNPKPEAIASKWATMLDQDLVRELGEQYGRDPKFADWLTDLFVTGREDWESISGEGIDTLADWHYLMQAGYLSVQHRDLNKIRNIGTLQSIVYEYRDQIAAYKKKRELEKLKQDVREVVLIDDDRYKVAVPLNYGACRVFNLTGHQSTFCTGGSAGVNWFNRYSPEGPLVTVLDKSNQDSFNGKWQLHAPTDQIVRSDQHNRSNSNSNSQVFAELFPGLMNRIVDAMQQHSKELSAVWPDINQQISMIRTMFAPAFN